MFDSWQERRITQWLKKTYKPDSEEEIHEVAARTKADGQVTDGENIVGAAHICTDRERSKFS